MRLRNVSCRPQTSPPLAVTGCWIHAARVREFEVLLELFGDWLMSSVSEFQNLEVFVSHGLSGLLWLPTNNALNKPLETLVHRCRL